MTTQTKDVAGEMFDQVTENFTRTVEMGTKVQQQAARFWSDMLERNIEESRTRFEKISEETAPFSKSNFDRFQRLFDQQANKSMDMLRQAFEGGKVSNPAEYGQKMTELWRTSFETLRESAETFAKTNNEMLENWSKWVRTTLGASSNGSKPAPKVAPR